MSESPETIRANIDRTREELGLDVDALADKVSPSKIVDRQTDRIKGAFGSVRERIMGSADDAGSSLHATGSAVASGVTDAGSTVKAKAQGNPLAVGLIAFGVGLVAASLIPASTREKHVAEAVKEQAQPLLDEASDVAKQVGENLKEPAKDAANAVKDTAADAVAQVKAEASDAAGSVADRTRDAGDSVRDAG